MAINIHGRNETRFSTPMVIIVALSGRDRFRNRAGYVPVSRAKKNAIFGANLVSRERGQLTSTSLNYGSWKCGESRKWRPMTSLLCHVVSFDTIYINTRKRFIIRSFHERIASRFDFSSCYEELYNVIRRVCRKVRFKGKNVAMVVEGCNIDGRWRHATPRCRIIRTASPSLLARPAGLPRATFNAARVMLNIALTLQQHD